MSYQTLFNVPSHYHITWLSDVARPKKRLDIQNTRKNISACKWKLHADRIMEKVRPGKSSAMSAELFAAELFRGRTFSVIRYPAVEIRFLRVFWIFSRFFGRSAR